MPNTNTSFSPRAATRVAESRFPRRAALPPPGPHLFARTYIWIARARLLELFVVDMFVASEFGCFGGGGNSFAYRLDYVGIEGSAEWVTPLMKLAAMSARLPPRTGPIVGAFSGTGTKQV